MATDTPDEPDPSASVPGQRVLDLLDKAIGLQSPLVRKNIARARQRNPEASPEQVIRNLERMYVSALAGTGAAVGGVAAAPGVGTGAALAVRADPRAFGPVPTSWPAGGTPEVPGSGHSAQDGGLTEESTPRERSVS
ncbi:hypothetical protein [Streptomyces sp. CBMA156]|uniref:hypothetical protein n=1 Tax=Streptomyces sp. CBMA156 TaxID=1930280 RepID=UPI001CB84B87|nr:hypothetical protein [Streptomyces sp. CBMA156]